MRKLKLRWMLLISCDVKGFIMMEGLGLEDRISERTTHDSAEENLSVHDARL